MAQNEQIAEIWQPGLSQRVSIDMKMSFSQRVNMATHIGSSHGVSMDTYIGFIRKMEQVWSIVFGRHVCDRIP